MFAHGIDCIWSATVVQPDRLPYMRYMQVSQTYGELAASQGIQPSRATLAVFAPREALTCLRSCFAVAPPLRPFRPMTLTLAPAGFACGCTPQGTLLSAWGRPSRRRP